MNKCFSFGTGSHWRYKKRSRNDVFSVVSNTTESDNYNFEVDSQEFDGNDDLYTSNEDSQFDSMQENIDVDEINNVDTTNNVININFELYLNGSKLIQGDQFNVNILLHI